MNHTREIAYSKTKRRRWACRSITTTKKNSIQSHIVSSMFATHVYYIRLLTHLPQFFYYTPKQKKRKQNNGKKYERRERLDVSIVLSPVSIRRIWSKIPLDVEVCSINMGSMMGVQATMETKRDEKKPIENWFIKSEICETASHNNGNHTQFNCIRDKCEAPSTHTTFHAISIHTFAQTATQQETQRERGEGMHKRDQTRGERCSGEGSRAQLHSSGKCVLACVCMWVWSAWPIHSLPYGSSSHWCGESHWCCVWDSIRLPSFLWSVRGWHMDAIAMNLGE